MIRVQIQLDCYGLGSSVVSIGSMDIWNDGSGTKELGNYGYSMRDDGELVHHGEIKGHKREENIFQLMKKVFADINST